VVDKFTKWIKAKLAAYITATKAVEFICEIMCQFDVPNNIITDNGTQSTTREFRYFCADAGIKINYPQSRTHRAMDKPDDPMV
jgi:transposase InsO family protein